MIPVGIEIVRCGTKIVRRKGEKKLVHTAATAKKRVAVFLLDVFSVNSSDNDLSQRGCSDMN